LVLRFPGVALLLRSRIRGARPVGAPVIVAVVLAPGLDLLSGDPVLPLDALVLRLAGVLAPELPSRSLRLLDPVVLRGVAGFVGGDVDGVRIPGPVLVDHDVLSAEQVVLLPVARGPAVPDVVEVHGDLRLDALPLELLLDDLLEDELLLLVRHLMPRDRDLHGDVVRVSREDLVVVRTEPGSAEILLARCTAPWSLRCTGRVLLLDLLGQRRGVLSESPADRLQAPSGTAGPPHAEALRVRSPPEPLAGPHLPVEGRGVGCQALLRCVDARCELTDLVGVHAEEHRCISWCGERKGPTRPGSDGARLPDLWPVPHASRGVV